MQNYMLKSTYIRLVKDIEHINNVEIPAISKEKLEAARQGDLSENAEYEAAKEKLDFLHSRFLSMQSRLTNPVFIDDLNVPGNIVSLGTIVSYKDMESEEHNTYTILGTEDSDTDKRIISFQSPIAKGMIGKKIGDKCHIQLPDGDKTVIIEDIQVYLSS